ncbi:MAG: DUF362 domain-containing protein [Candidatus Omnitrophota bacterium]
MKPKVYFQPISQSADRKDCLLGILNSLKSELEGFPVNEIVGIKTTIGDNQNKGYIKPELIKLVVAQLKALKLKPFVFDTNVIYRGSRRNAVDHLNLAYQKGFGPEDIGTAFIIADGVFGSDSRKIEVNLKNLKEIRVPSLVGILENLIVISHVTGHMLTGYAGSIKNVAMGMASRAGKQIQHSSVKPYIKNNCTLCKCCIDICPVSAISERKGKAFIDSSVCLGCGECISACKFEAVYINWEEESNIFIERVTEYAWGILSRLKRRLFLNFAFDVTKECDCLSGDDPKIISDAGIFASSDILAVDKACFDVLTDKGKDVFAQAQNTDAHLHQFKYAREIGLGRLDYELVRL